MRVVLTETSLLILAGVLACAPVRAQAQTNAQSQSGNEHNGMTPAIVGQRVRVESARRRRPLQGTVVRRTDDSLMLRLDSSRQVVALPRPEIVHVHVALTPGERAAVASEVADRRRRSARVGASVGLAIGLIGAALYVDRARASQGFGGFAGLIVTPLIPLNAAGAGYFVGRSAGSLGRRSTWRPLPPAAVWAVGVDALNGGGALTLGIRMAW